MRTTSLLAPFGLACATLLVGATASFAQDDPKVDCDNQVTQFDMNHCANVDYEVADAALNATYKTVLAHMAEIDKDLAESMPNLVGAVEALKAAQRAWIGYRDGQCELAGFSARGGSMEPMLVSSCLADLTTKRTVELKELLEAY
ncbi:lysozyme inhibitor LprI family protein [Rhizobium sp. 32-5/1]|uniref:lysozyme inhibitor LprI family protein n=1 Tax=Rhizobium sp. 32-5/1 TaxID=3019602 RepID=UPI00240E225F|nr:lysozyme inhibitor LprI family protein [Rhizobium sp. 32-5/1]WEZ82790.1 lysozyme inhibitor LprI family protein [Rhizobium sp. 32-5/1]